LGKAFSLDERFPPGKIPDFEGSSGNKLGLSELNES